LMEHLVEGARQLGLSLSPRQIRAFQVYYQELVAWNERFNLTAITGYREVQLKHFLDSLSCLLAIAEWRGGSRPPGAPSHRLALESGSLSARVIDIGTGAGFPGLPLKIVCPRLKLTLLEATRKKVTFLEHIVDLLGIKGVEIIHGRAEEWGRKPAYREGFDLVLARALAELPTLAEYTLPFCRLGGMVIAPKGDEVWMEVRAAENALAILGGRLRKVIPVELFGLAEARSLVLIDKVAATPPKYPRRPGIPAKRPLR